MFFYCVPLSLRLYFYLVLALSLFVCLFLSALCNMILYPSLPSSFLKSWLSKVDFSLYILSLFLYMALCLSVYLSVSLSRFVSMRAALRTASNAPQSAKPEIEQHVSKSRSASAHSESAAAAADSKGRDCESFFSANSVSHGSSADLTQTPNAMVGCVLIFIYHFLLYTDGATEDWNGSSFKEVVVFVNYTMYM